MNIEPLETRIAPAALFINATTATYTDVDGDLVTVKFSKPLLTQANIAGILNTTPTGALGGDQLTRISLVDPAAAGTDIAVTAKPQDANGDTFIDGDGLVNVGEIEATGIDLGKVTIRGDLGQIRAGNATAPAPGVKALNLLSHAAYGPNTGAPNTNSNIAGLLGSLTVASSLGGTLTANGIGAVTLGALTGGGLTSGFFDPGTLTFVGSPIGVVKIRGDLEGVLFFGKGSTATIGGSVTGTIDGGELASVKIAGDVRGSVTLGTKLGSATVGGSLIGNNLSQTGYLYGGSIGSVKITGDLRGGSGANTGMVDAPSGIKTVFVGGSVIGGGGTESGKISAEDATIGTLTIGVDLRGGSSTSPGNPFPADSGFITAQGAGSITIGGSIVTGSDLDNVNSFKNNGAIAVNGAIKSLTVKGSVIGNDSGANSNAYLSAAAFRSSGDQAFGKVTIGGSLENAEIRGGFGSLNSNVNADAQVGTVSVGGDWIASRLIVGVQANAGGFGDANDTKSSVVTVLDKDDADATGAVSRIASVIIKGNAIGTTSATDTPVFSIEAQHIVSIKVSGATEKMQAGRSNDLFALRNPLGATLRSGTADFFAYEVA